jgi:hypothetical protein
MDPTTLYYALSTVAQCAAALAAKSVERLFICICLLSFLLSVCCIGCGVGRPPALTLDQWEALDRRTRSTGE